MRFAFIDTWKEEWPIAFLCKVMQVTSRGFRAWRVRPMSQRQRDDMVILDHIREQHRLSLESYGRPRMTEELQELGVNVGHPLPAGDCKQSPRGARGSFDASERHQDHQDPEIQASRAPEGCPASRRATTDSNHAFNIAPNLLDQDFSADGPNQKWAGDISYIWTNEGWLCVSHPKAAFITQIVARNTVRMITKSF